MRARAEKAGLGSLIAVESAGVAGYHVGDPPDPRTVEAALARGYDLREQRAQKIRHSDLFDFDLIVAMDQGHLRHLQGMGSGSARLMLFGDLTPSLRSADVPDPYYGGEEGFTKVLDMIETGCAALLDRVKAQAPA